MYKRSIHRRSFELRLTGCTFVFLSVLLSSCGGSSNNDDPGTRDEPVSIDDPSTSTEGDTTDLDTGPGNEPPSDPPVGQPEAPNDPEPDSGNGDEMPPAPAEVTEEASDTDPDTAAGQMEVPPSGLSPDNVGGGPADCSNALPCTWRSSDGGLTLLLTSADGENVDSSGRPRIDFSVTATRDTDVSILRSSTITAGGNRLAGSRVALGGSSGFGAAATESFDPAESGTPDMGLTFNGYVTFRGSLTSSIQTLENLTLEMTDAGTDLRVVLRNVPYGRDRTADVDCMNALPCSWISRDGDVTVSLDSFTSRSTENRGRSTLGFTLNSSRTLAAVLGGGSRLVTNAGNNSAAGGLRLADAATSFVNSTRTVEARIEAGIPATGVVLFEDAPEIADTQASLLVLNLFERSALRVPRWNPIFRNVPISQ